jgi:hypothetical protein
MKIPKKLMWLGVVFFIAGMTAYYAGRDSVVPAEPQKAVIEEPLQLAVRTKTINCIINDSLPDPQCTPGAVFPDVTKEQVCVQGYTKTVRSVPVSLKKKVYSEYDTLYPPPFGSYEADHFIPLALGGNNDIANLFPEAAEPRPGFREKDLVENYLHEQVCLGNMSLLFAQKKISTNWLGVYNNLSPYELERLKREYKNWTRLPN